MTGFGLTHDYHEAAAAYAEMAGVPVDIFKNLVAQESEYRPDAYNSGSGATGLTQLRHAAVQDVDLKFGFGGAPMASPMDNLKYGAHYLKMMTEQFGGNVTDALMAYNWGPGNVRKWIDSGRNPAQVPPETRRYVQKITSGKMNPMAAGFAVNNFAVSSFNYARARVGDAEPGYDPILAVKGTPYERYAPQLVDSQSTAETEQILQNITNLELARERLAEMPWASRLLVDAVTSVIDVPSIVPLFGWASKARTIGGAMMRGAADVALQSAAVEGALHGFQEGTRTWQESAMAIGTAAALGAILGPAVRSLGRTSAEAEARIVAAAREFETLRDSPLVPERGDAGAAEAFPTRDMTIADPAVRKTVAALAAPGSPVRNPEYVLQTAGSPSAKVTAADLFGSRLETEAARRGEVADTAAKLEKPELSLPALRAARMYMAQAEVAASKIRDAFVEGRFKGDVPRVLPGIRAFAADAMGVSQRRGVMTFDEFNREVHHALYTGEVRDTLAPADRAAVEKATKVARDLTDTMRSKLLDAGLTSESKINKVLEMDPAYFIRSYDRAIIKAKSDDFSEMVASFFVRENEETARAIAEAEARRDAAAADVRRTIGTTAPRESRQPTSRDAAAVNRQIMKGLEEFREEYRGLPGGMSPEDAALFDMIKELKRPTKDNLDELANLHLKYLGYLPERQITLIDEALEVIGEVRAAAAELRSRAKAAKEIGKADVAEELTLEAKILDERAKMMKKAAHGSWKQYVEAAEAVRRGEEAHLTPQDIKELVDGMVDRITGSAYGRGFDPLEPVKYRGSTKERTLPIPTSYVSPAGNAMNDFIEHDITSLLLKHGRYVGTDVALAERGLLPKHGLEERKAAIVKEYHDLRDAATTEAERTRIINEQADVLHNIDAVVERMRGRYGIPDGAGGTAANRWAAGLINYSIATKLLGQTISSIPDLGKAVFVHGMKRTLGKGLKTYVETFSDPKLWEAFKGDFERSGTMLEMALTGRLHELWDVLDNYGQTSKFERGLHWMAQNTFTLNLSRPWNSAMQHIAAIPAMDRMLRAIISIADGEAVEAAERTALARLGIGQRQAKMIASQRKHFIDHKGVLIANTDAWDDSAQSAGTLFRGALGQWVDDIIVRPQEERPFWASSSWGRVIFQFKAFSQASTTATLLSGLQRRDAAVFQGAALMMALGVGVAAFKEKLRGRETSDWETLLLHGADQSGLAGILTEPMRMVRHIVKGDYDMLIGQAAGPTFGTGQDAVLLFGALSDEAKASFSGDESQWTDRDTRRATRMVPWLGLLYGSILYQAAYHGIRAVGAGEEP